MTYCVIGLGNPGTKYTNTRHNIGFEIVEEIAAEYCFPCFSSNKYNKSMETKGMIAGKPVLLLKPQTYMNLSGESLTRLKQSIPPEKFIVIYDDFDLELGIIRIRDKGSAGSHNGMKSVIQHLGTNQISRIRVGIRPDHPIGNCSNFVLGNFNSDDKILLEKAVENTVSAIEYLIKGNYSLACQKFNKKPQKKQSNNNVEA